MRLAHETTTIESWLRVCWCFNQFRGSAVYNKQDWMAGTVKCWTNQTMTKKRGKAQTTPHLFYLLNIWMFALCTFLVSWSSFHCQHLHRSPLCFTLMKSTIPSSMHLHSSSRFACSLGLFFFCTSPTCVCIRVCWRVSCWRWRPHPCTNTLLTPVAVMKRKPFVRRRSTL